MTEEVQGNANIPVRSLLQKYQMLKAYGATEKGTEMPSPTMSRQKKHHGVMIVDNRNAHIDWEGNNKDLKEDFAKCTENTQRGAQTLYGPTRTNRELAVLYQEAVAQ